MSRCKKGFTDALHTTPGAEGWLWECPNMKEKGSDFRYERYECEECGERTRLDTEEMK